MISYTTLKDTPVGDLFLAANSTSLIGLYFSSCDHVPIAKKDWELNPRQPILQQAEEELRDYFNGTRTSFSIPLRYGGTDFQHAIWRQIASIPFGETITYTDLAQRAGASNSLRAAGTATGKNPIAIIIPCHRVVGKNGALGGFAGGLERKRRLLRVEMSAMNFKSPLSLGS